MKIMDVILVAKFFLQNVCQIISCFDPDWSIKCLPNWSTNIALCNGCFNLADGIQIAKVILYISNHYFDKIL